jgi:hypothetical protein
MGGAFGIDVMVPVDVETQLVGGSVTARVVSLATAAPPRCAGWRALLLVGAGTTGEEGADDPC